ncbi:MAG: prepilin-type N-terminal cleavage/methylation domain-containing protein [Candidatus Acidiferrales bacterium]
MAATTTNRCGTRKISNGGFSLIELLVVVAIILIIAAIAIPNFLRSKMAANEAAAVENVRTITTASVVYNTTWGNGYPPLLSTLGGAGLSATCNQAILIDSILATGQKSGYKFVYAPQGAPVTPPPACASPGYQAYLVSAKPTNPGITGQRSFCSSEPGVIHYDITGGSIGTPTACDLLPALQ